MIVGKLVATPDVEVLGIFYTYAEVEVIELPMRKFKDHERMENRHIAHREIKHRMYAERVARRNMRKGAMING